MSEENLATHWADLSTELTLMATLGRVSAVSVFIAWHFGQTAGIFLFVPSSHLFRTRLNVSNQLAFPSSRRLM